MITLDHTNICKKLPGIHLGISDYNHRHKTSRSVSGHYESRNMTPIHAYNDTIPPWLHLRYCHNTRNMKPSSSHAYNHRQKTSSLTISLQSSTKTFPVLHFTYNHRNKTSSHTICLQSSTQDLQANMRPPMITFWEYMTYSYTYTSQYFEIFLPVHTLRQYTYLGINESRYNLHVHNTSKHKKSQHHLSIHDIQERTRHTRMYTTYQNTQNMPERLKTWILSKFPFEQIVITSIHLKVSITYKYLDDDDTNQHVISPWHLHPHFCQ